MASPETESLEKIEPASKPAPEKGLENFPAILEHMRSVRKRRHSPAGEWESVLIAEGRIDVR